MNPAYWLERAEKSLTSASLVADAGDFERAASTAYYAMFYAARVALLHVGQPDRAMGKTHSGVVAVFSEFVVRPGFLPVDHQRALSFELNRRIVADYEEGGVTADGAQQAMTRAKAFVVAVRTLVTTRR